MFDGSADDRDGAVFTPRAVRAPLGRPPIVATALAVAVGGLVLVGLLKPGAEPEDLIAAQASEIPALLGTLATRGPARSSRPQVPPATVGALLQLSVQRDGRHLFVHGEVYTTRVTAVVVSLRDAAGKTAATRTVSLPGGSTAFRTGAVDRFEVRFDQSESLVDGPVTIQASGYDAADDRIASVQVVAGAAAR